MTSLESGHGVAHNLTPASTGALPRAERPAAVNRQDITDTVPSGEVETTAARGADATLPLLTNSSVRTFRRCARLYKLRYEDGYEPVGEKAAALRFGTLIHVGLEAWWMAAPGERLAAAIAAIQPEPGVEVDPFDQVRAEELLAGYDARWGGERLEAVTVEAEFTTALRNPETGAASRTWSLAGKVDGLVRELDTGRLMLLEHKTTSEPIGAGSDYWKRLVIDPQVSTYFVGARALGYDVSGCIYDVLAKPAIRPLKATPLEARKFTKDGRLYAAQREADETPDEFRARFRAAIAADPSQVYQRGEVVRLEDEERDAAFDVWQAGREIRDAQVANRWPRNPDACVRFGRTCDFFAACSRTADVTDPTLFRRADRAHRELSLSATNHNGAAP